MLNRFSEKDFAVLRGPFETGRQSPNSFSGMLVLAVFLQIGVCFLVYVVGGDRSKFPFKEEIILIHIALTSISVICSIIYAIPGVWKKSQKGQYLVSIIVSQNLFGVSFYIAALFFVGKDDSITVDSLLHFTYTTVILGVLIFIVTCIRFYILLKKGAYRKGSGKDELRKGFETKSYMPIVIVAGLGLVYVIQYFARYTESLEINSMAIIVIGIVLLFAMLFVLPEQLVLLYCKYRFDSFNYNFDDNDDGVLRPMGSDRKDA